MYIQSVNISNIRAIEKISINFSNYAGWHVIIGDNGAGKSTIIRSIALLLIGSNSAAALRPQWNEWLRKDTNKGTLTIEVIKDENLDSFVNPTSFSTVSAKITLNKQKRNRPLQSNVNNISLQTIIDADNSFWSNRHGWFSVGYGAIRRFIGNATELESLSSYPRVASHISIFEEGIALGSSLAWLHDLNYRQSMGNHSARKTLNNIIQFINTGELLPYNSILQPITPDGIFVKDGNNKIISVTELGDGYRSILSLTLDLIYRLRETYGVENVFKKTAERQMYVDLPGVVLIDEIDAHLHPTWQVKIGKWLTKYFPKIQFIVTTHSPLICQAAENGTIWRLAAPGSNQASGEITGLEKQRLVFGNVLDAFSTEAFGENVSRSKSSQEKFNRMAQLNTKSIMGIIAPSEEEELQNLKEILPTGQ